MYDEQESPEHEIAPELAALERQLRGMAISPPRVDRDRLMFVAGQAAGAALQVEAGRDVGAMYVESGRDGRAIYDGSGRPVYITGSSRAGRRFWPAATFIMTAATLLLATMLVWQRQTLGVASQNTLPLPTASLAFEQPGETIARSPVQFAKLTLGLRAIQHPVGGYLGVRYAALMRGVDALEPSYQASTDDADPSDDTPQTQRNILEELLPSARQPMNPRS